MSYGGLPQGQTIENFFKGVSHPRSEALMRIMRDLAFVERTGHGIPNVVRVYGKEAFEIADDYILVTLPYDKEVLNELNDTNDTNNDTNINKILNEFDYEVYNLIQNGINTTKKLIQKTGKSKMTIIRSTNKLVNNKKIKRIGSTRTAYWEIVEDN